MRSSTSLLVLVPLRVEAAALGRAGGWQVIHTGMGEQRARVAAARARAVDAKGVAVVGVCAAAAPGIEAGDVVVASEVRDPSGRSVEVPGGALLVAGLRRRGLTVHLGPIASVAHVTSPGERARLAAEGAIAVDMESAWLAEGAAGRPLAVVRVVTETAARPLAHPALLVDGTRALVRLRKVGGALADWGRAIRDRNVVLAGPRSFCAGVDWAIKIVERTLELHGAPVYVRKQIVHNEHVVSELEGRGAVFVDELDEVPEGGTVVFSAHGVSPAVRTDAVERGLDVIDAMCPLVGKVHAEARRFAAEGRTIFLIGHDGHEEVEGTMGEAPDAMTLVEDLHDAEYVAAADPDRVAYLTQTTLAVDETETIVNALRRRYPNLHGPSSADICYATANRQQAVREIAADCDVVLVAGSRTSSNSRRLVEVVEREGTRAYLVDDETGVDAAWLGGAATVGLTAGASAPERIVRQLVAALATLGTVEVDERTTTTESLQFRLPKEIAAS
jgi:4-hydroxy-3-methylbut-2-enyl diphosphate reductase